MSEGIEFNADGELEIQDPWLRQEIAKAIRERRRIKLWSRGFARVDTGAVLLALRSVLGREIPGVGSEIATDKPCSTDNALCPCWIDPQGVTPTSEPAAAQPGSRMGEELSKAVGGTPPKNLTRAARKART